MERNIDPELVALVELMNVAINRESPTARIMLTRRLVFGFGRLFIAPKETLEQLVAKFEQEMKEHQQDVIESEATRIAANHVAFLKTFLKHRAAMVETLSEFGITI